MVVEVRLEKVVMLVKGKKIAITKEEIVKFRTLLKFQLYW